MSKGRVRSAAVRLFVISKEIGMNNLNAALDVEKDAEANQFAKYDADEDSGRDEDEFADDVFACIEPFHGINEGQRKFKHGQGGQAQESRGVSGRQQQGLGRVQALEDDVGIEVLRAIP